MLADRQGSVLWVTEPSSGSVLASYEYDAYRAITQTQGTLSQPYGYTGREYDAESGLYHYRARSYDPRLGLFVQSDPIGFESGQANLFQYVQSDPYGKNDPSGLTATGEFYRGSAIEQAESIRTNSHVFSAVAGLAGATGRFMMELDLFQSGVSVSDIPKEKGICSQEVQAQFDKMKPHTGSCKKGPENIGYNLTNMRTIQFEIVVRTMELAMCYEGGARGDEGHPGRLQVLFNRQDKCARMIKSAVIASGPGKGAK